MNIQGGTERPAPGERHQRGMDDYGDTALFIDRGDHQIAQYDDWETGKSRGWWRVDPHTFMALE